MSDLPVCARFGGYATLFLLGAATPPREAHLSKLSLGKSLTLSSTVGQGAMYLFDGVDLKRLFPSHHREEGRLRHKERDAKHPN